MKFIERIDSSVDNTKKFIFEIYGSLIEFSYINKNDGKDIICVPSQTSCNLGCTFCHLTVDRDTNPLPVKQLSIEDTSYALSYIINNLGLREYGYKGRGWNETLLISFMGAGEALVNPNLVDLMLRIRDDYQENYVVVRFGMATILPKGMEGKFQQLTESVNKHKLNLKVHLSLHSPRSEVRRDFMPNASDIRISLKLLSEYKNKTNNNVEIHYTTIDGINDTEEDFLQMEGWMLDFPGILVKFLKFNPEENSQYKPSKRVGLFQNRLEEIGVISEYYESPGHDIGASCGEFLKQNKI